MVDVISPAATEITETMRHSKSLNPLLLYIKVKVAQVDSTLSI